MKYLTGLLAFLLAILTMSACAEKRTAADSGDDMYVVSDGMLAVDTVAAGEVGITILDRAGEKVSSVVPLRHGFSILVEGGESAVIGASPDALFVLDANNDNRIDANDPAWQNMHLAVDYNGDGAIGSGEYALIGECGVDALVLDSEGQAWSLHAKGDKKPVVLPVAG